MFSQPRTRLALLSVFAVLAMLLVSAGAPDVRADRGTIPPAAGGAAVVAAAPCNLATPFKANTFPSTPSFTNPLYPLVPGTEFVLDGRVNVGGQRLAHQVILIVTDLTKVVHGVRTVVLWDRDFNIGVLTESELAFHAQDNVGNIWNLGEYPAQYAGGQFTNAPDTWISGLASKQGSPVAQGGMIIPGDPKVGTPLFLQAYAEAIIGDCGQVAAVNQRICNIIGCYDNTLVIDETSPPEAGTQQKFYAPGVGNFQIGAINNDPQGETLVLSETVHLGRDDCIAARQAALALEDQAYNHDVSQTVYDQTTPMEQTGFCETLVQTPTTTPQTPTPQTPTPQTPTPQTPTPQTPTPGTPTPQTPTPPTSLNMSIYLPIVAYAAPPVVEPTVQPTVQPTVPPAVYDGCKSDPNPAGAVNFPVRVVAVDKVAEIVTLQNVSDRTVSLEDWNMCSLSTNQDHDQIFGTIAPGQIRSFPNIGAPNVWLDSQPNDGALYNAAGFLVSYWVDQ